MDSRPADTVGRVCLHHSGCLTFPRIQQDTANTWNHGNSAHSYPASLFSPRRNKYLHPLVSYGHCEMSVSSQFGKFTLHKYHTFLMSFSRHHWEDNVKPWDRSMGNDCCGSRGILELMVGVNVSWFLEVYLCYVLNPMYTTTASHSYVCGSFKSYNNLYAHKVWHTSTLSQQYRNDPRINKPRNESERATKGHLIPPPHTHSQIGGLVEKAKNYCTVQSYWIFISIKSLRTDCDESRKNESIWLYKTSRRYF